MPLDATQVFTPTDFPAYTYIQRRGENLEQNLRDTLATPNLIPSLSGPSKSGKTVLVKRVVTVEKLIIVSGAEIHSVDDLWNCILDDVDAPETVTEQTTTSGEERAGTRVSGRFSVPGVAVEAERADGTITAATTSTTQTRRRGAIQSVVEAIGGTDLVVLIDDFHYIEPSLQILIAQQIKAASERGVRIAVAVVPHRSDDVVRNNAELRGRVRHIDTTYWSPGELRDIALTGFPLLNIEINDATALELAEEACGSPQLMQAICLQACMRANFRSQQPNLVQLPSDAQFKREVLEQSALTTDYSSLVRFLHMGPRIHGTERTEFAFRDGSRGDTYRAVLLAIALPPPDSISIIQN